MTWGALLAFLCAPSVAIAGAARLKADATLYARPSATSEAVGQIAAGTRVEALGESNGWREVKTQSGQGYVRSELLVLGELGEPAAKPPEKKVEKPPAARERPPDAPREAERVPPEEFSRLADEVRLLRERPEPATAADLERLQGEVARMVATTCQRPAAGADPAPVADTSIESTLAVSPVLLLVGGIVGWVASRIMQRRRESRNRIRI